MQQSDAPSKIRLAWAANGTKNTIPVASQISVLPGRASYNDGFPPLTMTPVIAGGIPPAGNDFNGILNALSAIDRWNNAGAGYVYDSTFASDSNVGGYPAGSRVARTDGLGYWLNTADNNTTDPEAGGAGWVPDVAYGSTIVAMNSSNVTLTSLQSAKKIIIITGTLTANVNLILPTWVQSWQIVNNATGAFAVTVKTASGSGVAVNTGTQRRVWGDGTNINDDTAASASVSAKIQPIGAAVATNALTATLNPTTIDFRSATLSSGTVNTRMVSAAISITVPSGATLGTVSGQSARIVLLALDNAGTVELAVANLAGGINLDETTLISTTAISGSSNSANVIYSTTARSSVPFRIVGFVDATEATAGTWATAPSTVQGIGGQALAAMSGIGYGQTCQDVTGSRSLATTYYNTSGKPITVHIYLIPSTGATLTLTVNGVAMARSSNTTGNGVNLTELIPPGASYSAALNAGTASSTLWTEIR